MTSHSRLVVRPQILPVALPRPAPLGVSGHVLLTKLGRNGQRVPVRTDRSKRAFQNVWEHAQGNLITDAGLDLIGTQSAIALLNYIAVGTGSAEPAFSDTALVGEIARTNANLGLTADTAEAPTEGLHRFTRGVTFDFGQANGNLTEIGGFAVASGGSALTRALFQDEGGTPVPITKTNEEQLVINYAVELGFGPTQMTPAAAIEIAGLGSFEAEHMFYQAFASEVEAGLLAGANRLRVTALGAVGSTYGDNRGGASTWGSNRGQAAWNSNLPGAGQTIEPYVGGSHELVCTTQLTAGTDDSEYGGYILYNQASGSSGRFAACGWRFTNPTTLLHHKDYRLRLSAKFAWARG